jgi:hypothetical protein
MIKIVSVTLFSFPQNEEIESETEIEFFFNRPVPYLFEL